MPTKLAIIPRQVAAESRAGHRQAGTNDLVTTPKVLKVVLADENSAYCLKLSLATDQLYQ